MTRAIRDQLRRDDAQHPNVFHQAMVLVQSLEASEDSKNAVDLFLNVYNNGVEDREKCESYVSGSAYSVVERFKSGQFRTLIIIGRLLEGFDHANVSVVAIARNVQPTSRVMFTQFVGRALRKATHDDPVKATVISHVVFKQKANFDAIDTLAVEEVADEDEDLPEEP